MSLETSVDLEEKVEAFSYDYEDEVVDDSKEVKGESTPVTSMFAELSDFVGNNYSLLFFFLLLVIIFSGSGSFYESNESLLFFFLILVIIFNQFY